MGNGLRLKAQLESVTYKQNVVIASSSHTGSGTVPPLPDDAKNGFVSADSLNPSKARILLMLALTKTTDVNVIQEYFNQY